MSGLPKELYRLVVHQGSGRPLGYGEQGGGTYHQRGHALNALDRHRDRGRDARLFVTTCDWKEVE